MIFTRPMYLGDTYWYVLDIKNSFGHGWIDFSKLWDFPHLLWRPIGRILSDVFLPLILGRFHQNAGTSITFLLVCLNVLAALICGLVVQAAAWRLTGNQWAATLAGAAFLCVSSVLNYSRSGSSYVVGLAFLLIALYLAAFYRNRSWKEAVLCGFLSGMAVLVWVPYLVSVPAVFMAGPVLNVDERSDHQRSLRYVALAGLATGVIVAGFYMMAIAIQHIHTVPALLRWIHETSHDPERSRKLIRMAMGFPRSVYELGDDALWIKWFLFRDPYAKVGLLELLRVPLLKLVAFYATLSGLAIALWRSPVMGRRLFLLIVIAMIPNLGMALMYESGSPERYLPFLPLVFIGFGYVLGNRAFSREARIALSLLCCAHIPVDLYLLSAATVNRNLDSAAYNIAELASLPPGSHVFVINGFDVAPN